MISDDKTGETNRHTATKAQYLLKVCKKGRRRICTVSYVRRKMLRGQICTAVAQQLSMCIDPGPPQERNKYMYCSNLNWTTRKRTNSKASTTTNITLKTKQNRTYVSNTLLKISKNYHTFHTTFVHFPVANWNKNCTIKSKNDCIDVENE